MKNIERRFYQIVIAVCLLYIAFTSIITGPQTSTHITSTKVDTSWIIHQAESDWSKPKPDTIILPGEFMTKVVANTEYRYMPSEFVSLPVDTQSILRDYFSKIHYRDSMTSQFGVVYVEDSVNQNRIYARKWSFDFKTPIITNTVSVSSKPKSKLLLGVSGIWGNGGIGGNVNIGLQNKREQQFEIGYGFIGNNQYGFFGTKIPLTFKRIP